MILIQVLLAFLWHKVTMARALICAALVICAFAALQPIIEYGRSELEKRYGAYQAEFGDRYEILVSYFSAPPRSAEREEVQSAASRITYVNAATFVIHEYDMGRPGNWPELLPAVFVPRFLWPEKPIITDVGLDIYELGTGRRTSASGAGVFADAYWAMGWWGIVTYMLIYGAILGALTTITTRIIRDGRWFFFPFVLMALQIGFRTDGHYISDVAGATVIAAGMYLVLTVLDGIWKALRRPGRREGHSRQARP